MVGWRTLGSRMSRTTLNSRYQEQVKALSCLSNVCAPGRRCTPLMLAPSQEHTWVSFVPVPFSHINLWNLEYAGHYLMFVSVCSFQSSKAQTPS